MPPVVKILHDAQFALSNVSGLHYWLFFDSSLPLFHTQHPEYIRCTNRIL